LGKQELKHRILSVAEEAGVRDASYGLKLLQSEGRLSLISTSKEGERAGLRLVSSQQVRRETVGLV
jgi:hypothetical protein